jgi:hypothetical protein
MSKIKFDDGSLLTGIDEIHPVCRGIGKSGGLMDDRQIDYSA